MVISPADPNFLVKSTFLIGALNLVAPFVGRNSDGAKNLVLIALSLAFLFNVLIIDFTFLQGVDFRFQLVQFGKYAIEFALEPLGIIFLTLLAFLWLVALIYTISFLQLNHFENTGRYLFFTNLSVLSGCFIAIAANMFTMFIGYEILTLATIPLIIHLLASKSLKGLGSYLKILMTASVLLFLPAIIIVYAQTGDGSFIRGGFLAGHFSDTKAIFLLLAFTFGISKIALYPLHGWLPAAMVASYPVSALLHAVVVVKAGLFCFFKILVYVFGLEYLQALFSNFNWFVLLPAFTVLYGSVKALKATEIKMVFAYSTISQLGIALMSAAMFTPKSLSAAVLHMISHSFTKICLFYSAGNFYSHKHLYHVHELKGMAKSMPVTALIFAVAGLSLIGIPPFAGFVSKFYIMLAAIENWNFVVIITLVISSVLSGFYMLKMISLIYTPNKTDISAPSIERIASLPIIALFLCLGGIGIFVFYAPFINGILRTL